VGDQGVGGAGAAATAMKSFRMFLSLLFCVLPHRVFPVTAKSSC
jgi:hypothetical protein